ncbi:MAG: hypothetical protein ACRENI_09120 [Gemmatimonadaceae bacterium]
MIDFRFSSYTGAPRQPTAGRALSPTVYRPHGWRPPESGRRAPAGTPASAVRELDHPITIEQPSTAADPTPDNRAEDTK